MISIKGARQHNLKGIDLELPHDKLIVITGVSGSGKSSLAFDTIYAEGQRRYIESFSSYARQFLEQMEKPLIDSIEGLSPSISIDQRGGGINPRSTVGTVTECYDYLRLLYSRTGTPHCPLCNIPIEPQSTDRIISSITSLESGTRIQLLAPVVRAKKGEHREVLSDLASEGFSKVRVDGEIRDLSGEIKLARYKAHNIEVVVDRLKVKEDMGERFLESLHLGLRKGDGSIIVDIPGEREILFSIHLSCPKCNFSIDEIAPRIFSFNSPYGACPACSGIGTKKKIDPSLLINDTSLSIADGAIPVLMLRNSVFMSLLKKVESLLHLTGFLLSTPLFQIKESIMNILLYGSSEKAIDMKYSFHKTGGVFPFKTRFNGLINYLEEIFSSNSSESVHDEIERLMIAVPCEVCCGMRLKKESLSVTIKDMSIGEISKLSIKNLYDFISHLSFGPEKEPVSGVIIKEIKERLHFLLRLGVGYLSLDRSVSTLSGGELQRMRLATQISSGLVGVLYILDEPTVGLHQRDNEWLLEILRELRDMGNTVIIVEHDEKTIRSADYIVDLGPGAGISGGELVACGRIESIMSEPSSLTGQYLSGKYSVITPQRKSSNNNYMLTVKGAKEHNLKNIEVNFPLGLFNCVTGVSGSGKSTLVNDILYKALTGCQPGVSLTGTEHIDRVIMVDQTPIGRTPRSNPATYTGVFTYIREIFALTPGARLRGYKKGRFSFNIKGGRCERCLGSGKVHIEMHFLPDIYVTCEECKGKRYNSETFEVIFKEKNIYEVLEMTVLEAIDFFSDFPKIKRILETLKNVGLGYIHLGQPATFLSGGEAQRIKLAFELARKDTGKTLYILDEPTTGLHFYDVGHLLKVLHELKEKGNTIIVIEHNIDVIKSADYIIDLGPEGGEEGGYVVACGTPEEIARTPLSHTGRFIKPEQNLLVLPEADGS
ncbi:MAG TPA: excinuclease ABC subunit UvrA [Candidatus Eremiobacteraeota bacterium]|nr:excinuclease ABC subunit UvrA [Candidatus Eremiobacteraeota bacterium]